MAHDNNVSQLPCRETPGRAYSAGYEDGMHFGARCANQRYLWIGIAMGCVLSTVIALAVLHYLGATK